MSTRTLISLEEYLASSYEPDCDFVDGHLEERNVGEWLHSALQGEIHWYIRTNYHEAGIRSAVELRIRVKPGSVRVPDVTVVLGNPRERVLTKPPFVCIEILSPEDRMSRVEMRIRDYLAMGVPYVWVIDPETRQLFEATAAHGLREVLTGVLRTADPVIELPMSEIWTAIEE